MGVAEVDNPLVLIETCTPPAEISLSRFKVKRKTTNLLPVEQLIT